MSIWQNRQVPILAIVDLPHEEDPPITGREQVLATRYYLRIHPPDRGQAGTIHPMRWDIPMAGVSAGVARVLLIPSVGYGINSTYRVEYVAWRPILNGVMVKGRARVRVPERVVKEEHWKVPQGKRVMRLTQTHVMDRDTIPIGIIKPLSVTSMGGEDLDWDIAEVPLDGTYDKSLRSISMRVDIPIGEQYIIEYIAPLTLRDVLLYPNDRTHTEDILRCHVNSQCCPPLSAPWGRMPAPQVPGMYHTPGTQVISTPWYY